MNDKNIHKMLEEANQKECDMLKKDTDELLSSILYISSMRMKNGFFLSDN